MRINLLLAALSIAATTAAFAADTPPTPTHIEKAGAKMREKFDAADLDHDGLLTRDEAAKGLPRAAKHFDEIDVNHDGKLSMQEVAQYLRSKHAAREETQ
ncbi:MAG TPA: EF-hand domain-containing protein [Rudaea sp.]|jgi:Ca2+-binding EF-hand superfamily protein|nr:EF-hand domain-containing protein [Rudaea sp.]